MKECLRRRRLQAPTGAAPRCIGVLRLATLVSAVSAASACVPERPPTCGRHSDCEAAICTASGTCARECDSDRDCTCDSYCERTCGLCVRTSKQALASCFAPSRNVPAADALGSCFNRSGGDDGGADSPSADAGVRDPEALDGGDGSDSDTEAAPDAAACVPLPLSCRLEVDAGSIAEDAATDDLGAGTDGLPDAAGDVGPPDEEDAGPDEDGGESDGIVEDGGAL